MAKKKLRQQAIDLRKKGFSYSQIKDQMGTSKSTLNYWLRDMPLSEEKIRELRGNSAVRIERYRNTMKKKRELRFANSYDSVAKDIGSMSPREIFLAGIFLYWAEGTKGRNGVVEMTNTNPYMLRFFMVWLGAEGVEVSKIKIHLHLYTDMDIDVHMKFWSKTLSIPLAQFHKPYIKVTNEKAITYKNGFGHGTCSVIICDSVLSRRILMGIQYLQETTS
jgi:hypothetical protein